MDWVASELFRPFPHVFSVTQKLFVTIMGKENPFTFDLILTMVPERAWTPTKVNIVKAHARVHKLTFTSSNPRRVLHLGAAMMSRGGDNLSGDTAGANSSSLSY